MFIPSPIFSFSKHKGKPAKFQSIKEKSSYFKAYSHHVFYQLVVVLKVVIFEIFPYFPSFSAYRHHVFYQLVVKVEISPIPREISAHTGTLSKCGKTFFGFEKFQRIKAENIRISEHICTPLHRHIDIPIHGLITTTPCKFVRDITVQLFSTVLSRP